jgi:putative membrane protein
MIHDQKTKRNIMNITKSKILALSGVGLYIILLLSGIRPFDRATWLMEVAPVFIATPVMVATYRRFPLTSLLYGLIFIHALILIAGGAYTYARVPLGFHIQELLSLSRNPYDKIGHFAQGFVPALIAREIFLRGSYVRGTKMAGFLSICVAMAISAWYELIEWGAAVALGQGAEEFLGTQGDQWDTQSDMFLAFIGATAAIIIFSQLHDRFISQMDRRGCVKHD